MAAKFLNVPATLAWIAVRDEGISSDLQNFSFSNVAVQLGWHYPKSIFSTKSLKLTLEEQLSSGEAKSLAVRNRLGSREPIPPYDWYGLTLQDDPKGAGIIAAPALLSDLNLILSEILISVDDIIRIWPASNSVNNNSVSRTARISSFGVALAAKTRGRRPTKFDNAVQQMRIDISAGKLTPLKLDDMVEKELASNYGVCRDTARKARKRALELEKYNGAI